MKEISATIDRDVLNACSYLLNVVEEGCTRGVFRNIYIYNENYQSISVKVQLDTGATCNIIGYINLKLIEANPDIKKTDTRLKIIEGTEISTIGTTQLTVRDTKYKRRLFFFFCHKTGSLPTIIGRGMNLIEIC